MDEARHIASIATEDTEEEWLRTLPWYTPPDFARLVELAARGVPVLQIASGVVDKLIDELTLTDRVRVRPEGNGSTEGDPGPQPQGARRVLLPEPRVSPPHHAAARASRTPAEPRRQR